ncbi:MAG: hypothetical protein M3P30_04465 [Chloroflexota bacterium]|nr:hypothetical protein [Chloroflexota bacterium]
MTQLFFETDAPEPCPVDFRGASDVLVHFLSLAFATRYGSLHPLSQLALLLRGEMKVDLRTLTTFADRNVEEEADRVELERVWQDAAPLARSIAAVVRALDSGDERIAVLTEETPDLRDRLDDLRKMAEWAAERGARARLTFEL